MTKHYDEDSLDNRPHYNGINSKSVLLGKRISEIFIIKKKLSGFQYAFRKVPEMCSEFPVRAENKFLTFMFHFY